MSYTIQQIEAAFFNYDNDGSEDQVKWEQRRREWAAFRTFLDAERLARAAEWAIYWAAPENEWVEGRWPNGFTQEVIYRENEWWNRDECVLEHPSEWRPLQPAAPPLGRTEGGAE